MGRFHSRTNLYGMDSAGTLPQLEQCNLRPSQRIGRQHQGHVQQTARQLSRLAARRGETEVQTVRAHGEHIGHRRAGVQGNHRLGRESGIGAGYRRGDGSPLGGGFLAEQPHEIARTGDALDMRVDHAATLFDGGYGKHGERDGVLFSPRVRTSQTGRERQTVRFRPVVRNRDVHPADRRLRLVHRQPHRLRTHAMAQGSHARSNRLVSAETERVCPACRHDGRISQRRYRGILLLGRTSVRSHVGGKVASLLLSAAVRRRHSRQRTHRETILARNRIGS